ncbi:MAG: S-methyl-5'-thioadenosine phosphorylase [Candidatus Aminicenantes bacterium]|nr:S-methyl-5'-thioadenosine phosphorylase [Candidatus Aminicenantes bacterium]
MDEARVGIIGGSGLYDMPLEESRMLRVPTPFGDPSDSYLLGKLEGQPVAFLARHGRGHRLLPSELNFRANIYGFKRLGVRQIISASAVGSLKIEHAPMDFVLPDQFVDRTFSRVSTFFGEGIVAHVSLADPICSNLMDVLQQAAGEIDLPIKRGGTYVCMEGPAFSTRAESCLYRSWGMDLIGMTNLQEAKLAREAEICYVTVAMVTDYDCWHEEEEPVTVEMLIEYLNKNSQNAKRLIARTVTRLPGDFDCPCHHALQNAIITDPDSIPAEVRRRLEPIVGKYLD